VLGTLVNVLGTSRNVLGMLVSKHFFWEKSSVNILMEYKKLFSSLTELEGFNV